jgi:hypothetical protein
MSDEVVGGVNLEDDGPPLPVAEPTPEPVAEAPPEPQADAPAEVEAVEVAGQRYVPHAALAAERAKGKALAEKASRVDALEQEWRNAQPYVEFLRNNPDLLKARQPEPVPAPVVAPEADPDALEAARLMDFYRADGSPDLDRGARWLALQEKRAEKIAQARVAPILQQTAQDQAALNFQRAQQIKAPDGRSPSIESLQAVWQAMPADLVADPRVAGVLAMTAIGMDAMRAQPRPVVVPPSSPALVSEPSGGNPRTRPALSALEERIAADKGISATKWAEHTRGYQPGRATQLED